MMPLKSNRLILLLMLPAMLLAQDFNSDLYSAMKWRLVGPFRGGRITAVTGIPGQPATFLAGTPGGGLWRTTDAGRTWQPVAGLAFPSIGAIAVAPSDPKVIYVGTGEQIPGQGMFKSTDGGVTFTPIGLTTSRFIQSIIVDPRNPNLVVVGANDAGASLIWPAKDNSPYGEGAGIFRTIDGGKTWSKAFMLAGSSGVVDMCAEPGSLTTLYASFYKRSSGTGDTAVAATSVLYKSANGGATWTEFMGKGLPEKDLGRAGVAATKARRLYLIVNQGFYRSDDSGLTWKRSSNDPRVIGSEYFSRVFVDPNDADKVYVSQTSMYRSVDGGLTFAPFAGAPSGDDYHLAWIDPANSEHIILGVDQGAEISLNGGKTWSSWDNQPTGQFYHVITDNQFPYRIYAAQQDSGTAAVLSRGDSGQITPSDWFSIAGFEYCYIAPDPLHPNLVYSGGWYGSVVRFDRATGQVATVFERGQKYRAAGMAPLFFMPQDPGSLMLGMQYVLKTTDGGLHWREMSPDLTVVPGLEAKGDEPKPAISALAASPIDGGLLWAGTTNRMMHITRDGGESWQNVSPPDLPEQANVRTIEPSHFAAGTAFITLGAHHATLAPLMFRTRDFGKTWQSIVNNLPATDESWVVREDPARKGLLYAGTALGIYVSFDEGDHWHSLQLNLPQATVTDIAVHGVDLVVSTFGRALWVLDDVTPLRQFPPAIAFLKPADAIRTHWDTYQDTPLSVETPTGTNPPDGAILDYVLTSKPAQDLKLDVYDEAGKLIRSFTSNPSDDKLPPANVPEYWFAPKDALSQTVGLNRFVWDLRYAPPQALAFGYYGKLLDYTEYTLADHAIAGATPRRQPMAALVLPGTYTLELTVDGKTYKQMLHVKLDPRVAVSESDLQAQAALLARMDKGMAATYTIYGQLETLRAAVKNVENGDIVKTLTATLDNIEKGTEAVPGIGPVNRDLARMQAGLINADARPTEPVVESVRDLCRALDSDIQQWREMNAKTLPGWHLAGIPVVEVKVGLGCQ